MRPKFSNLILANELNAYAVVAIYSEHIKNTNEAL